MRPVNERDRGRAGPAAGPRDAEGEAPRGVIAGGDTSGHAAMTLGIYALTALAPIAPGAPCAALIPTSPAHAGLEIALKGGQMGAPDYFRAAKQGCG